MGSFSAKLRIWNPAHPENSAELEAMVETGASFSWVHRERLEQMGVTTLRKMGFRAIDGSIPDTVVVTERSDMEVIGAHTIEGLGLAADPVQKRLVPTIGLAL